MNKAELIDNIAESAGITKTQANAAMDAFTTSITSALKNGDTVTLVGFGTFSVSERSARTGRNPQSGETIQIAARKVARFKPGKGFSTEISGNKDTKGAAKGGSKAAPAKKAAAKTKK